VSFEPGTVIAGKYRVERLLGEGGMGVVLAAHHLGLDEMVAIKLIHEERATSTDAIARFQREARAAARIKSEHVARVLDVDRLPEGDPYIVMEYIDGTDLHALVKKRRKLDPDEAAGFIVQACEGLAEAHALGMVHRDLKLKNLFLTQRRDGRTLIKVIDFGVVKFAPLGEDDMTSSVASVGFGAKPQDMNRKARDATLTSASMIVGSVHYMAPEQIRASNIVDARADVWSLGVCLYVMLTGKLPFDGQTVGEVCGAIQGRPPFDVRAHEPGIPDELAAAVSRALEKNPARRFASVGELANGLSPFHADRAAVSRIETILESSVKQRQQTYAVLPEAAIHETQEMAGAMPGMPFHGRIESTVDAAAIGSLATQTPMPAKRTPLVAGGLVLVAAAAATVFLWTKQPPVVAEPGAPSQQPAPAITPAFTALPAPTPTPTPEEVASAAPSPPPPPPVTGKPAKRPGPAKTKPAPAVAAPAPAPKPEPKNAYDQF
jgi:serine/threonine-protein kinase